MMKGIQKNQQHKQKKDIQTLVKEKSILVKVDFSKQDDIDKFFGDDEFPEYVEIVSNVQKIKGRFMVIYTLDDIEAKIIPIAKQYNISKVYLFGSYARGEEDENSDIDIALELEDVSKYMDVYGCLSSIFGGNVDILLVSDLLSPRTNIGALVKKSFLNDRILLYHKQIV